MAQQCAKVPVEAPGVGQGMCSFGRTYPPPTGTAMPISSLKCGNSQDAGAEMASNYLIYIHKILFTLSLNFPVRMGRIGIGACLRIADIDRTHCCGQPVLTD